MKTTDFDYQLPQEYIAQRPVEPRDRSRMMIVDRTKKTVEHKHFYDLLDYLRPGDLIVWNNSKVFKARLYGELMSQDGEPLFEHKKKIEIFLVRPMENRGVWQVLARPGRHARIGTKVRFHSSTQNNPPPSRGREEGVTERDDDDFVCEVLLKEPTGTILVQFPDDEETVRQKANKYGRVPLPPYVKDEVHELSIYQTVYAKHEGSVAAPTAGFHFTPELIEKAKKKGVEFAEVTLHVGLGTFLPVKSERVEDHTMHSEWVEVSAETAEAVNQAKREGRRIIAVGTTTARTLEGVSRLTTDYGQKTMVYSPSTIVRPYTGEINLFIVPGFRFQIIDALITNFHLPKSTLLMLVCAFAGDRQFVLDAYQTAIKEGYRFYSFGDAMMISSDIFSIQEITHAT